MAQLITNRHMGQECSSKEMRRHRRRPTPRIVTSFQPQSVPATGFWVGALIEASIRSSTDDGATIPVQRRRCAAHKRTLVGAHDAFQGPGVQLAADEMVRSRLVQPLMQSNGDTRGEGQLGAHEYHSTADGDSDWNVR